jgi:hypothetical protein
MCHDTHTDQYTYFFGLGFRSLTDLLELRSISTAIYLRWWWAANDILLFSKMSVADLVLLPGLGPLQPSPASPTVGDPCLCHQCHTAFQISDPGFTESQSPLSRQRTPTATAVSRTAPLMCLQWARMRNRPGPLLAACAGAEPDVIAGGDGAARPCPCTADPFWE